MKGDTKMNKCRDCKNWMPCGDNKWGECQKPVTVTKKYHAEKACEKRFEPMGKREERHQVKRQMRIGKIVKAVEDYIDFMDNPDNFHSDLSCGNVSIKIDVFPETRKHIYDWFEELQDCIENYKEYYDRDPINDEKISFMDFIDIVDDGIESLGAIYDEEPKIGRKREV